MTIFAKQGEYEPCGIFTKEHFLLRRYFLIVNLFKILILSSHP